MYDIIGDIHGHADKLEELLLELGYKEDDGVYQHPERTLISVGDLIDRGPYQKRSVDIIRKMCERGHAKCIMGNHEFNAVAWATTDTNGHYLREHSDKNRKQHGAFLLEAEQDKQWYEETIDWFKTLPIYLELDNLRIVHACWHTPSLDILSKYATEGVLHNDAWISATTEGHELFEAIQVLCKGWEIALPEGFVFHDKDDNPRTNIRTKWWQEDDKSYQALAIGVKDKESLPSSDIPGSAMPGYDNPKPLFIGHYWMKGEPCLQSSRIACVDWSVAAGGKMVAYRLNSSSLNNDAFVAV
mgnify:CR=1 FL=1